MSSKKRTAEGSSPPPAKRSKPDVYDIYIRDIFYQECGLLIYKCDQREFSHRDIEHVTNKTTRTIPKTDFISRVQEFMQRRKDILISTIKDPIAFAQHIVHGANDFLLVANNTVRLLILDKRL